jgi:hypothetical protein
MAETGRQGLSVLGILRAMDQNSRGNNTLGNTIQLQEFFGHFGPYAEKIRSDEEKFLKYEAPNFRMISLFKPNETDLSRVIGYLLDPNSNHGQSVIFFESFISTTGLPKYNGRVDQIRISLEDVLRSKNGRSDIQVQYQNEKNELVSILIENKPMASDGPQQMKRYADHMSRKYGNEPWFLIYLSDIPKNPSYYSIEEEELEVLKASGRYINISYKESINDISLYSWINQCQHDCRADRPRHFLSELLMYLRDNFSSGEGSIMNENRKQINQEIFDFFCKNTQQIDVAELIYNSYPEICKKLVHETGVTIMNTVRAKLEDKSDWEIQANPGDEPGAKIYIRNSNWKQRDESALICVAISFEGRHWSKASIGILIPKGLIDTTKLEKIRKSVDSAFQERFEWIAFRQDLGSISRDWRSKQFQKFALNLINGDPQAKQMMVKLADEIYELVSICKNEMVEQTKPAREN